MITNQILQSSLDDLKAITRVDLGLFDLNGEAVVVTSNMQKPEGSIIVAFAESAADSQMIGSFHLLKVKEEQELIYILVAQGFGEDTYMVGRIATAQISRLIAAYKDKFDRNNFFQNLILDNLLLVDVYNKAKKLHIDTNVPRCVYLIDTGEDMGNVVNELLKNIFAAQNGDYITSVDENSLVLIKAFETGENHEDMMQVAHTITDMINTEVMINVRVGFGTMVEELKNVSKSYKEARMALDVGKIFYSENNINAYDTLGIGRLIYQLPVSLCKMFIEEIFGDHIPEELDEETLHTVNKFFENNLNVSETSRQLFLHRNTLVYRIEKLQKSIGLDIRVFDDALTLKIVLMVVNYLKYLEDMD
ncbi:PucR family transcriptional regulator [Phocaeicola sp.]|uniref:PucR family transcriptional regulator n=1 Tax=Phocaeicola sp. TaxID=2773926 RepID=UPI0038695375